MGHHLTFARRAIAALVALTAVCGPLVLPATPVSADTATTFHALTPARLQDTRSGPGYVTVDGLAAGGGALGPGQTIELAVRGRGGVPLHGTGSVALNLTATDATATTYVTAFPGGATRPTASTLNVGPGDTVANSTIVRLGPDGTISLYNHAGDVHLVVDVLAWVPTGAAFTGLTPARLLDTRAGDGVSTVDGEQLGAGPRPAGSSLVLPVAGRGGVPASGAGSVALNVTVTEPTASTYVTVHPSSTPRPNASNLNTTAGRTVASMVVVPLGVDGAVDLFQFAGSAHLIVDVLGWFPVSLVSGATSFTGVTPARLADTRTGPGIETVDGLVVGGGAVAGGSTLDIPVVARGGLPASGVGSIVLNVTVTEPTAGTYVTVFPTGATRPTASNVNAVAGRTVSNTVIVPIGADGSVSLFQFAGSAHLVVDVLGWFPPSIELPVGVTQLISAKPDGFSSQTNWATEGSLTSDGRLVVFGSWASDLVVGDLNGHQDVFLRDRVTGVTELVSVSGAETQGDGASFTGVVSGDGRFVAFYSAATNLVAGDTNGQADIFVRDRQAGTTTRVSVATGGAQALGGPANQPFISEDGRYVAFVSLATNLVAGDTNAVYDVFRHDRETGTTIRVSVSDAEAQMASSGAFVPTMTADGRFVTFTSASANLVVGDGNGDSDVFVRDVVAGTTSRVSVSSSGGDADGYGSFGHIAADGRYVAFLSDAGNLVAGDTNGVDDVFVRDLQTGTTERVSVSLDELQSFGATFVWEPKITPDGRFVVFSSDAADLVDDDVVGTRDGFVRDRSTGITFRVSIATDGSRGAGNGRVAAISDDGSVVVVKADANLTLTSTDTNAHEDVYVRVLTY
jgi:Tol biopolymer transport system component